MSTKIYDGLKLKDPSADLFEVVDKISKAVRKALKSAAEHLVGNELASAADEPALREQFEKDGLLWFAVEDRWRKKQDAFGVHHRFNDPLRFSIVFGRSSQGNILAKPFYDEQRYEQALKKTRLFDEYGYWDNSDEPEELTREQWKARGKEWDSVLNKEGTFGDLPGWELGDASDPWRTLFLDSKFAQEDLNFYRTPERRLKDFVSNEVFKLLTVDGDKNKLFSRFSESTRMVRAFAETEEWSTLELPAPLPTRFHARASELPPLYVLPEGLAQRIIDGYTES